MWLCLGVCLQVYERALPYFELAAAIQPKEVKWSLMVASCYRRIGAYDQALRRYASKHYTGM
jgi:intraflagellar transport protein 88